MLIDIVSYYSNQVLNTASARKSVPIPRGIFRSKIQTGVTIWNSKATKFSIETHHGYTEALCGLVVLVLSNQSFACAASDVHAPTVQPMAPRVRDPALQSDQF